MSDYNSGDEVALANDWYGRKRDDLSPLTRAWFIAAMQPHSHDKQDGTPLCALTPPRQRNIRSYAGIVILVTVLLAAATWAAFAMGLRA